MKTLLSFVFICGLITSLTGCVIVSGDNDSDWSDNHSWQAEQKENRNIISELSLNSNRQQVQSKLGKPAFTEAFMIAETEYHILYYRTHHHHSDGKTTKDETTPLVFKNNRLIGWGEKVLNSIRD